MAEGRQNTDCFAAMNAVMALYRNEVNILIPDNVPVIDAMKMKLPSGMAMNLVFHLIDLNIKRPV